MPNKNIVLGSLEWEIIVFEFGNALEVLELRVTNEREPEFPLISGLEFYSDTVLEKVCHLNGPIIWDDLFITVNFSIFMYSKENIYISNGYQTENYQLWKCKCWNWTFVVYSNRRLLKSWIWNAINEGEGIELSKNDELCNE